MTPQLTNKQNFLFECSYIFFYLQYYCKIITLSNFSHFYSFFFKIHYFYQLSYFLPNIKFLQTKIINQFNEFNINAKTNDTEFLVPRFNSKILIRKKKTLFVQLFKLFFLFSYSIHDMQFPMHAEYRLFCLQTVKNELVVIDAKKILHRWQDGLELLYNAFYYDFNSIIFSSPFFKNETLALNWCNNHFDVNLWKYYFPFFIFQLHKYNSKSGFFFEKLSSLGISFFIIVDCFYQYKNLFYIKKKHYYGVGLVSVNVNPWIVTYPIISFFENLIVQLFFFKLLIILQKQALFLKFCQYKSFWISYVHTNTLLKLL